MFSGHNSIKLEMDIRKITDTSLNTRKPNKILLNNPWVKEVSREIKKYIELNENENAAYETLWDKAKAVLRGKFIALMVTLKRST